jgi:hypothetical protein
MGIINLQKPHIYSVAFYCCVIFAPVKAGWGFYNDKQCHLACFMSFGVYICCLQEAE